MSQALGTLGYPSTWIKPVMELIARESGFDPEAQNNTSSANGMFQFLDSTRQNYGGASVNWKDPYMQALKGLQYIKDRYGTPEKALQYWDQHKSY